MIQGLKSAEQLTLMATVSKREVQLDGSCKVKQSPDLSTTKFPLKILICRILYFYE